tara:strand:- start:188 stop:349 length:162 start_codon:yes stop_codon:yes gene_type:complete
LERAPVFSPALDRRIKNKGKPMTITVAASKIILVVKVLTPKSDAAIARQGVII